jgi:Flp pilus assembly protein TadG
MRGPIRQRGVAAVELAILLVPLLTILFGITEFGRAMYEYNTIAKAARDAARLLSTQTPTDPDYAALLNNATCTAVYGNAGCTGTPLLPNLATSMVSVCDPIACPGTHAGVATGTGVINLVTVTIGGANAPYAFNSLAPFGAPSFNFGAVRVTMRQVL